MGAHFYLWLIERNLSPGGSVDVKVLPRPEQRPHFALSIKLYWEILDVSVSVWPKVNSEGRYLQSRQSHAGAQIGQKVQRVPYDLHSFPCCEH